jgi:hypothetical protein
MNMACTFCAQGRAAPAFYGTRNLPPVSADHAVRKQGRACNPRLLILRDQLLRETSPRVVLEMPCTTGFVRRDSSLLSRRWTNDRPFFLLCILATGIPWGRAYGRRGALSGATQYFIILRQLSTDGGSNDDGGRNRLAARRTSRMKAPHSSGSRSMDTVDNAHTDNTHIHNPGSHSRTHPAIQTQFRPKPEHQNAAREQKRIPRPPM